MTLRGESRRGVTYDSERFESSDEIRADKAASPIVEGFTAIIELGPAILWEREPSRHSVVFDPIAHEDACTSECRAVRNGAVDLQLFVGTHNGESPNLRAQLYEVYDYAFVEVTDCSEDGCWCERLWAVQCAALRALNCVRDFVSHLLFLGRSPRNPRAIHEELEQSIRWDVSRSMQFPDFVRREIEVLRPLARIQNLVAFGVSVVCQHACVRWLRRRRWLVI